MTDITKWHKWYAWYPVYSERYGWFWLQWVEQYLFIRGGVAWIGPPYCDTWYYRPASVQDDQSG